MSIRFDGKVAIVTGAGGGLGREHALELARRGAKVVVNDLGGAVDGTGGSSAAAAKVVDEIEALGGDAIANGGSVSDPAGAQSMVDDAVKAYGTADILINNAGILRDKSFKKMTHDDFEAVVKVHLIGSMYCTKAVWPVMEAKGYGRIVMTTSSSGLYGNFGQSNYGAAKLGLVGLMNTLKLEGGRKGVRVNTIAPVAATRMTADIGIPEEVMQKLKPELVTPAGGRAGGEQRLDAGDACLGELRRVRGADALDVFDLSHDALRSSSLRAILDSQLAGGNLSRGWAVSSRSCETARAPGWREVPG